jgi:phosphatidylglycerophosphate synthase
MAAWLARRRVSPNSLSVISVLAGAGAGALLAATRATGGWGTPVCLVAAAALIQVRLLLNMLDGMVAVEGGLGTPSGAIYNELPDRFADALILVGAGYGASVCPHGSTLGWLAALLAVLTAYVRTLGAACGTRHVFAGPAAKPHRMAAMTAAALAAAATAPLGWHPWILPGVLTAISLGCVVTIVRRVSAIIRQLEAS